jgi:hypothetical protein
MKKPNTVDLDTPIKQGDAEIKSLTLRKPNAGALRGTSINALVNLDIDALTKVLPRICTPTITELDIQFMDPADLIRVGVEFGAFLLPKAAQ